MFINVVNNICLFKFINVFIRTNRNILTSSLVSSEEPTADKTENIKIFTVESVWSLKWSLSLIKILGISES